MAQTLQQLFQNRIASTTATSALTGSAFTEKLVKTIAICNTSTAVAYARLFHDDDGTTYDQTTAILYDVEVLPGSTLFIEVNIMLNNSAGNLATRTSVASALTFTGYGSTIT